MSCYLPAGTALDSVTRVIAVCGFFYGARPLLVVTPLALLHRNLENFPSSRVCIVAPTTLFAALMFHYSRPLRRVCSYWRNLVGSVARARAPWPGEESNCRGGRLGVQGSWGSGRVVGRALSRTEHVAWPVPTPSF